MAYDKIVDSAALDGALTDIADAIRGKTGKTDGMTLDQMPGEIESIETGGNTDQSVGLIDGTLTEFVNAEVTNIRTYAFYYHSGLKRVVLPNLFGAFTTNSFRYCSNLEFVDAPASSIHGAAFANCTLLKTIVLRKKDTICNLENKNAFNYTPFASDGTEGTIYVPSELIENYKAATNWSTLYAAGTCSFVAIEGSAYE